MATLDPYIDAYMQRRVALGVYGPKSVRVVTPRLRTLSAHFGDRALTRFNEGAIVRWLGSLDHLAVNSRACYLVSVRQFTSAMVVAGHITIDPCLTIPAVRRVAPLPRSQPRPAVVKILAACRSDRELAIVWLMLGLGLRRMEVANVRWEHYDERVELIEIRASKGGKDRVLPVTPEVSAVLARLRGGGGTGPIIRSELDPFAPVSVERVGYLVRRIMERAGVKVAPYDGISGHALRHTAATDVLDECGDLRAVQEMLGHAHLTSTAIYLRRLTGAKLRTAMEGRDYSAPDAQVA